MVSYFKFAYTNYKNKKLNLRPSALRLDEMSFSLFGFQNKKGENDDRSYSITSQPI